MGGVSLSRYSSPDEPNFDIPQEITFIDAISLDEELQLIREQFREEMAPIEAAWDAYKPRRTWPQLLPMQILDIDPDWQLTSLQIEFLKHLVFQGEIAALEAVGLVTRPGFRSALDMLRDLYRDLSMDRILASSDLMWELQQECERKEAVA